MLSLLQSEWCFVSTHRRTQSVCCIPLFAPLHRYLGDLRNDSAVEQKHARLTEVDCAAKRNCWEGMNQDTAETARKRTCIHNSNVVSVKSKYGNLHSGRIHGAFADYWCARCRGIWADHYWAFARNVEEAEYPRQVRCSSLCHLCFRLLSWKSWEDLSYLINQKCG